MDLVELYNIHRLLFRLQGIVDVGISLPDIVLAFKILKQSNLPPERRSLVIAALHTFIEVDRSRSVLQEALGRFHRYKSETRGN